MKKNLLIALLSIWYLLWELTPVGVRLVQANDRYRGGQRHEQRHYRPQHRYVPSYPVFIPVPVYRYPRPIYTPAPVYYPRPQVIVQKEIVVVEKPVYIEREVPVAQPSPQIAQPEPQQPAEFYGQTGNGPVRCTDEQLRHGKAQMGTNGWLQDLNTLKRCYYDLTVIRPVY